MGVSTKPPVPMKPPSEYCSSPASSASAVASMTWSSETRFALSRPGSVCTWYMCNRSPQIATLATPGTRSSRARMFQYAVIDMSMTDIVSDDRPIFMVRLVDDSGWIITGGAAHFGRLGVIGRPARPRAGARAGDRCPGGTAARSSEVGDRLGAHHVQTGDPAIACSIGTVTSPSTSVADRPRHGTCTSTRGGANSGNTSTGVFGSSIAPKNIIADAAATTRKRNLKLVPMIQRIMPADPLSLTSGRHLMPNSAPHSSAPPVVTTAVPAGGPAFRTTW